MKHFALISTMILAALAQPAMAQLIPAPDPGVSTEITNTKYAPVQMQDVHDPLLDPAQFNLALDLGAGVLSGFSPGYTVPAGKRLVITSVVFRADRTSGISDIVRANLHTTVGGFSAHHQLRMARVMQAEIGAVFGVLKHRVYADPGTTVLFSTNHADNRFNTKYTAVVYGYFEKAQ